ncbi:MAG: dihydroorotase [Planctomycetota bacterium]
MSGVTHIANARVVDPSQNMDGPGEVLVADGVIAGIGERVDAPGDAQRIDARGLVVCPGLIDIHTHLREPGGERSETVASGARAAAMGGFTTICCMGNTSPACDTPMSVRHTIAQAERAGYARVLPVGTLTRGLGGEALTDIEALLDAGAGALSDDGRPLLDSNLMRRAMEHAAQRGAVIFDHCEDLALTGAGVIHEGEVAARLGLAGIPRLSESVAVARDCAITHLVGCRLHVCHVSTRESVEAIRVAKAWDWPNGGGVTAEVSPHHLTMTERDVERLGANAKMKPPLNTEADRLALIEAVRDGTIDCIATDHAPHADDPESTLIEDAPFGIIGLESALPVILTGFVSEGGAGAWDLSFVVEKMSCAPARVMGWSDRGTLRPGVPADITLLDPDAQHEFTLDRLGGKSVNCPWLGERLRGLVLGTMVRGRWIWAHEDARAMGLSARSSPREVG